MLQLLKNQVVTSVAKQQVEIRQLELDWYTNNYWTLSQQGKYQSSKEAVLMPINSEYWFISFIFIVNNYHALIIQG